MNKLFTVMLAAAGGFVAGILLAPKSGKETREDLMDKRDEYKAKAKEGFSTIKDGASSIKDEVVAGGSAVKNIAEDVRGDVETAAKKAYKELNKRGEHIKDNARETAESVKRTAR